MLNIKTLFNNLISAQKESELRKAVLIPLSLLSFFYGWAASVRLFLYARGVFRTHSLPCKVVSVGNITLGGTGKTPFVCLLAEMIKGRGYRVAVLSRGYKGNFPELFSLVSDGERILQDEQQVGDEPYLLAEKLKGVPVIAGKKRWVSGQYAINRFQSEVVILDDGFQHLPLKRDLDLLLIDSSCPFGNGYLFPRGVLREPLSRLSRADAIILTKVGQSGNIKKLKKNLSEIVDDHPIFQVDFAPGEVRVYGKEASLPPECLQGKRVIAFAGVAKPDSFRQTLLGLKAEVVALESFPDHYRYGRKDGERLWQMAMRLGVDALVTTEKDLVRVKGLIPGSIPLWTLPIHHVFLGDGQPRFEEFLFSRLGLGR